MLFDVLVLLALFISSLIAFLRGFIREVLTIMGVVGGGVAAVYFSPMLVPVIGGWIGLKQNPEADEVQHLFGVIPYSIVADIIAYGGVFIVVVIVLSVLSHFLAKGAKAAGLGALDRSFGVIFGIVRAVLLLGLLYWPVYALVEEDDRKEWVWMQDSHTHLYIEMTAGWIDGFMDASFASEEMGEKLEKAAEGVSQLTREKLENIDVLQKKDVIKEQVETIFGSEADDEVLNNEGYTQEPRQDIKDLIQENLDQDNPTEEN